MKKIDPRKINANAIQLIGKEWMLVTAGPFGDYNTMTASWGAIGELWNKPVAFVFIRPQRHTFKFVETNDTMTLSFFDERYRKALQICGTMSGREGDKAAAAGITPIVTDNGQVAFDEAWLILECRKLYGSFLEEDKFVADGILDGMYPDRDLHKMYVVEITEAWLKETEDEI